MISQRKVETHWITMVIYLAYGLYPQRQSFGWHLKLHRHKFCGPNNTACQRRRSTLQLDWQYFYQQWLYQCFAYLARTRHTELRNKQQKRRIKIDFSTLYMSIIQVKLYLGAVPTTHVITIITTRQQTSTAHQSTNHIRHNRSIQIGHVHHFELMWIRHQLHAAIIDNHIVVFDFWVFFGNAMRCFQEQAIGQFHNVGFVNGGHLGATGAFS